MSISSPRPQESLPGVRGGSTQGPAPAEPGSQRDSHPGPQLMSVTGEQKPSLWVQQLEKEVSVPGKVARWRDAHVLTPA